MTLGCGQKSDGPIQSQTTHTSDYVEGISLMGLVDGLTLQYLQTDTAITADSHNSVTVSTSTLNIEVSSTGLEYRISSDNIKWLNYEKSEHNVLLNGYWKVTSNRDSLYFFAEPPPMMPRRIVDGSLLTGYIPAYDDQSTLIFYNSYFGYFFIKTFVGRTRLHLPAGEFDCFQFDLKLFAHQSMTVPIIRVSEFYTVGLGLVKQTLVGESLKRTLVLTDYLRPTTEQ